MGHDAISEQDEQRDISDRPDRKRFTKKKLCLLLVPVFVILTMLLFFIVNIYHTPDLNELLTRARLAKLPESIQNLQVETRPVMDNDPGEPKQRYLYVLFQAEPNDINNFITSSLSIDKKRSHPLLSPMPDNDEVPTWWRSDDTLGRVYFLKRYEREYIIGKVFVYYDSNTVLIWASYVVNPQLRNMLEDIEDMRDAFDDFLYNLLHDVMDLFD